MDPSTLTVPGLSLSTRTLESQTIAELNGELDIASAPALRDQLLGLLRPGASRLVIDLSDVSYCDASGLAVLVGTGRRARLLGGSLRLAAPSHPVARVLRITGLDRQLAIFPTIRAAATSPQNGQRSRYTDAAPGADAASAHPRPASAPDPLRAADPGEIREAVNALLGHADAWRDADPGRRFTPALRALARAQASTDATALAAAASSLVSALARHPLTYSPAVAASATRLRRVLGPERRPALSC